MTETDFDGWFDGGQGTRFRQRLLKWYRANGRHLPWREARNPYRIWISEIMLQQTTVAAVVPYFERFLDRFPDIATLAAAEEHEVLRMWEGLGYYSRARNIHKAAKRIVGEFRGTFPENAIDLQKLPGIGRYTAGAIASFAFKQPAPIVEANTLRLYCRLLGFDGDPRSSAGQRMLWDFAGRLVSRRSPGEFNQAVMDLGSTICRIAEPQCDSCPVRRQCRAFAEGRTAEIPIPPKKANIVDVTEAVVLLRRKNDFLLRQREPGERWAGLWDFPRFELATSAGTNCEWNATSLIEQVQQHTGLTVQLSDPIHEMRHAVTRFRIRLLCFASQQQNGNLKRNTGWTWIPQRSLADYPLSVTGRAIAEKLDHFSSGSVFKER